MGTIRNLANAFSSVNFQEIVVNSIEATKNKIPVYNREQLYSGLTSFGGNITPKYRNPLYAEVKQEYNSLPSPGTPDLKLTGSFYNGIQTVVSNKEFTTFSTDSKALKLEAKYTKDIYGLDDTNKSKYALSDVLPVLMAELKAQTVGG